LLSHEVLEIIVILSFHSTVSGCDLLESTSPIASALW